MNILVVAPYLPWPLHGGSGLRMYNMLRALGSRGHRIRLLAGNRGEVPGRDHPLRKITTELSTFQIRPDGWPNRVAALFSIRKPHLAARFATPDYRRQLQEAVRRDRPDLVIINYLFLVEPAVIREPGFPPVVLDQHEDEELLFRAFVDAGTLLERWFARLQLLRLRRFRPKAYATLSAVLSVSGEEAERVRQQAPDLAVWTAPNGVDLRQFRSRGAPSDAKPRTVYCANYGVRRNVDAAKWFVQEVVPRIRKAVPEAEHMLLGRAPPPSLAAMASRDGVAVSGTVDDVRPYYEQARVVVVPSRFGAFTKLKFLEALAMGRPVVTTTNGCMGVGVTNGKEAFVADDPAVFADYVVRLLRDPELADHVGRRGREFAESHFGWERIVKDLEPRLRSLVAEAHNETSDDEVAGVRDGSGMAEG